MNSVGSMGEKGALFIAGRSLNYFTHYGNQYGDSFFKKLKIELPCILSATSGYTAEKF